MSGTYRPERDYDGRSIVHSTPRYRGTLTCFTSTDDSQTDPSKVWGGSNKLKNSHVIAQPAVQTLYLDFNTVDNKSYLLTGFLHWKDAVFDELTVQLVPKTTTYSASTNTNFDLVDGYLIVPNESGTGAIHVDSADYVPVKVTKNEFGDHRPGYWNMDYNTTTKVFENVTTAPNGDGMYNMFGTEIVFASYLNKFIMNGSQRESLTAHDADELGHGTRLKFIFETIGTDHNWDFNACIAMFREKTS
jgi:hypothetical protein